MRASGPPASPALAPVGASTWAALAALIALGAGLRLYGLDIQSLWNDELGSVTNSMRETFAKTYFYGVDPEHPPTYYLTLRLWLQLAGDAAVAARLPSAVCGIATIAAMFALGRRWFGAAEGLIAAGITTVAYVPVYFSQEARSYAVLLLAVTLSTVWLTDVVAALRRGTQPTRAVRAAFILAAIVASQAHFFGTLFVLLQAATAALLLWPRWLALRRLAAVYAVVAVAFLPCALRFLWMPPSTPTWLPPPGAGAFWQQLQYLFNDSRALAVAALVLWAPLLVQAARRPRGEAYTWLAVAWLIVPMAIAFAWSYWSQPVFMDRALIIVAPAAYLLAARGLTQLPLPRPAVAALAAALLAYLLADLLATRRYYTRLFKGQFREAAAHLVAGDDPARPALVLACCFTPRYYDYYLRHFGSPRRVEAVIRTPAEAAAQAARLAAQPPEQLWLLSGHIDCDPALLASLRASMTQVDEARFRRAAVWHFVRRQPEG